MREGFDRKDHFTTENTEDTEEKQGENSGVTLFHWLIMIRHSKNWRRSFSKSHLPFNPITFSSFCFSSVSSVVNAFF